MWWINFTIYFFRNYFNSVKLSYGVYLNSKTIIEGHSKIYKNVIINNSFIGRGTYLGPHSNLQNIYVGRYCSIGPNVSVIQGVHPTSKFISTHPAFYSTKKQSGFSFVDKNSFSEEKLCSNGYTVNIGHDVWIGANVLILAGVEIGTGSIIASGSVVTKNIKPYSIVGGNPARDLKFRFSEEEVMILLNSKWWDWSFDKLKNSVLGMQNIENFKKIKTEINYH